MQHTVYSIYELKNNEKPSVAASSRILANIFYQYRGYGSRIGTIIANWDKSGLHWYYFDDNNTTLKGNIFTISSGSRYVHGVPWYKVYLWYEHWRCH